MTSTINSLHKILKDEIRRKVILTLDEKGSATYTELMESLGIVSTGTLNYHLKALGDLLEKEASRSDDNLLDRLMQSVMNRCAGISFSDDVLLLSLRRGSGVDE